MIEVLVVADEDEEFDEAEADVDVAYEDEEVDEGNEMDDNVEDDDEDDFFALEIRVVSCRPRLSKLLILCKIILLSLSSFSIVLVDRCG